MTKNQQCSFCGNSTQNTEITFEAINAAICSACVCQCYEILNKPKDDDTKQDMSIETDSKHKNPTDFSFNIQNLSTPKDLKKKLDKYVIGQETSKVWLCVAVYNHYKKLLQKQQDKENNEDNIEIDKTNILMIGPTGCGKTLLAKTLAKMLDVPFTIADATTLTQAGYVGDDVENILLGLYHAANKDIKKAECGIVFIDEIDKIRKSSGNVSISRDVSGEGVQQALLKMIEGTIAFIPEQRGSKNYDVDTIQINTSNILFIACGAFYHLNKVIMKRIGGSQMGFAGDYKKKELLSKLRKGELASVIPEDLINYGMIPEFVGRFPSIITCHDISRDDMKNILIHPQNSILKQYKALFKMDGVDFEVSKEGLDKIVDIAMNMKTGARSLKQIMETLLIKYMFELPDNKPKNNYLLITEEEIVAAFPHTVKE